MRLVNLTPHTINIFSDEGEHICDIPADGTLARCAESWVTDGEVVFGSQFIPVTRVIYGAVSGLPEPTDDTLFIVSARVAMAIEYRNDVFVPGPAIRDTDGRIIGCRGLSRIH